MITDIEYSSTAFLSLEALPQQVSFSIVTLIDYLRANPEMGKIVNIRNAPPRQYRMLVFRRTHRVIYEYDRTTNSVFVGYVQDCRQKLPKGRDLKRDYSRDEELPLE